MREQRGSVSIIIVAAVAFSAILVAFTADAAAVARARTRARTAADAAALAAAQELIAPSGSTPEAAADEYARRHGVRLTECRCAGDEAVVSVEAEVTLAFLRQTRTITATARAVVAAPSGSAGLQPFFMARLSCLFAEVPGLWIVSGFRTYEEQAALHEQKPGLAAPPGHSKHELGLAADLGYPTPAEELEAHAEAPACGLRFPMSYEPWHVEPE